MLRDLSREKNKRGKAHRSGTLKAYFHTPKWDARSNEASRSYFFATHEGMHGYAVMISNRFAVDDIPPSADDIHAYRRDCVAKTPFSRHTGTH